MTGAELIAVERQRQRDVEGYDDRHDDEHTDGEMSRAAYCYLRHLDIPMLDGDVSVLWPWEGESWNPSPDPVRNLVKAGALIAAEIDRLHRESGEV